MGLLNKVVLCPAWHKTPRRRESMVQGPSKRTLKRMRERERQVERRLLSGGEQHASSSFGSNSGDTATHDASSSSRSDLAPLPLTPQQQAEVQALARAIRLPWRSSRAEASPASGMSKRGTMASSPTPASTR